MRRQVMALLDSEEGYAVRFMEYVNRQKKTSFEVRAFTEPDGLHAFLLRARAEIVLVAEEDFRGEMTGWTDGCVLLLSGRSTDLSAGIIFKYRAVPDVMKEIMEQYGSSAQEGSGRILKQRVSVIGVFSPAGRCMKTVFSVAVGQCLAARKPTVLLNFEPCAGFEKILHTEYGETMSDALYYIRTGEAQAAARILPMLQSIGALDYLPPAGSARELCETPPEVWERLLELFVRDSAYEAVVLDFGILPFLYPELLLLCDVIYMPGSDDLMAEAKIRSFFGRSLDPPEGGLTAGERLGERIRRIRLSSSMLPVSGDRWFESLPYCRIGAFAEECIARDGL